MNNTSKTTPSGTQQPTIAKYVQTIRTGIRSQSLTRHCIGFVLRGTKYIYYGDVRHAVTRGKVFYLDSAPTTSKIYRIMGVVMKR